MGSKVEYTDSSQVHLINYVRNARAVAVLWAIFSICLAVICAIVFVQPHWIADSSDAQGSGHFGLYKYCVFRPSEQQVQCFGSIDDFSSILSTIFQCCTVLVGLSAIVASLSVVCMMLFLFLQSPTVFHICGWLQILSALCMAAGVVAYPSGWEHPAVGDVCGDSRAYRPGQCRVQWAFILAAVSVFDGLVLGALALILGTRYVVLQAEPGYAANASVYKGEFNGGYLGDAYSIGGSRKSMNLQPVMLIPQDIDRFSDYSRTNRQKNSSFHPEHSSSIHNVHI